MSLGYRLMVPLALDKRLGRNNPMPFCILMKLPRRTWPSFNSKELPGPMKWRYDHGWKSFSDSSARIETRT